MGVFFDPKGEIAIWQIFYVDPASDRQILQLCNDPSEVPQAGLQPFIAGRRRQHEPQDLGAPTRQEKLTLKSKPLSPELRQTLIELEDALEVRAADEGAIKRETTAAVESSKAAESSGRPGIYVYTLPHYRRYPVDPDTGQTLLKVGHSSTDAHYRAGSQGRLTALPEDPILLRIYAVDASAAAERDFHEWLRDADHPRSRTTRGGSEWFLTSTKFLDRIARSKGLEIVVVNEFEGEDG